VSTGAARPRRRLVRVAITLAIVLGYAALMWLVVFPWLDHIVNRPAV
jgi:hypothetical protein